MNHCYVYAAIFATVLLLSCKNETQKERKEDAVKVTVADVEAGIRANIAERVEQGDGYFHFSKDTFDLRLKLVRVHTEYLSVLGPDEYFACVDLATEQGDVYDVDFFLKGSPGNMEITRTDIHKLNGKPFYTWKQAGDKTWYTVPVKNADNRLLGVIEGNDQFEFLYTVELPQLNDTADLWLPVAKSDRFQEIDVLEMNLPKNHVISDDGQYGNRILYVRVSPEFSHKTISIRYLVNRKEKEPYTEGELLSDAFLASTPLLPVGDRFSEIADSVIAARQAETSLSKARALYDYIVDNVRYAKQGRYGTGDANYACDIKSGNCTEFHSLFISLARSAGIPARFAVGAAIPSERNEGGINGYHCWAEFYADGKWWPVDISEANKYSALATYYFGHHPANRIEFSKGRDILPDTAPASGTINFFVYPVLEVKGASKSVKTTFTFRRENKEV